MRQQAPEKPRVLLVAPSEVERAGLRLMIEADAACDVIAEASDGETALALAEELEPDIAVIDCALADVPALGLVHFLGARCPRTQTLLYTDACGKDWICAAVGEGVRAFVLKRQIGTHLVPAVQALSERRPYWIDAVDDQTLDEMVERGACPLPDTLSSREWQVLQMAIEEKTSKEMARTLSLSLKTVENLRKQLRRRLGLRNRADLIRYVALRDEGVGC